MKIQDALNKLETQRQTIKKSLHRDHQDPVKIQKAMDDMTKRFETTTLKSPAEEKKILQEIKTLKATLPSAEQLTKITPEIDRLYTEKKVLREKLNGFQAIIDEKDAEINTVKKEMEEAKEQRLDIKSQLDKYEEDIQKVKEDLQTLYDKKNLIREEYFQTKLEFELERDEIYQQEWIVKQKQRILDNEKYRLEKIESRKQALLDRPHPYQKEIDTCEHLIAYCNKLKVLTGLVQAPVEE